MYILANKIHYPQKEKQLEIMITPFLLLDLKYWKLLT